MVGPNVEDHSMETFLIRHTLTRNSQISIQAILSAGLLSPERKLSGLRFWGRQPQDLRPFGGPSHLWPSWAQGSRYSSQILSQGQLLRLRREGEAGLRLEDQLCGRGTPYGRPNAIRYGHLINSVCIFYYFIFKKNHYLPEGQVNGPLCEYLKFPS